MKQYIELIAITTCCVIAFTVESLVELIISAGEWSLTFLAAHRTEWQLITIICLVVWLTNIIQDCYNDKGDK